ncbi:MAG: hypothetical protein RL432_376 [Bacteroidota bacterium]|jgi:hypothetical protein
MFKGYVSPLGAGLNPHLEEIESRTLSARYCERIEGCGIKVEEKILAFLVS